MVTSAITILAALLAAGSVTLSGQTVPTPEFAVASIKPSVRTDTQKFLNFRGGSMNAVNHSLKDLIQVGWDVRSFQVAGGPGWLDSDRYNVEAKPAESIDMFAPGSDGIHQVRSMVQSLLADRFNLKLHREEKEMSVLFLRTGKNGIRVERTAEAVGPRTSINDGKGQLNARQVDMGMLARELGGVLGVAVIDKTELGEAYDIKLEWNPDENASTPDPGSRPSIFTALQQQLGLKLESGRGPVEVLVVDHAEKASAN